MCLLDVWFLNAEVLLVVDKVEEENLFIQNGQHANIKNFML